MNPIILNIFIPSHTLVRHIIKVAEHHSIWFQIFYKDHNIHWLLGLPEIVQIFSRENRFSIYETNQHLSLHQILYQWSSSSYTTNNGNWLILDPIFYLHIPPHSMFWKNYGEWISSIVNYLDKNIHLKYDVITSRIFQSKKIIHLLENCLHTNQYDLRVCEFFASNTIFNIKWLSHTGSWIPVVWGMWIEWLIRGVILNNPEQFISRKRALEHKMKHTFYQTFGGSHLNNTPIQQFWIEMPPVPNAPSFDKIQDIQWNYPQSFLNPEWNNYTWSVLCQLYPIQHLYKWTLDMKVSWSDLWFPWDISNKNLIPSFPRHLEAMLLPSDPYELTIFMTGCVRIPILRRTLRTFLDYWMDKKNFFVRWIIHIDPVPSKPNPDDFFNLMNELKIPTDSIQWIFSEKQNGLANSFKKATYPIQTNFAFYLQDDWEFIQPFYLERVLRELLPLSSNSVAAHFYKTDGGSNKVQDLIYMSPSIYKTHFLKQWAFWSREKYDPEQLLRPYSIHNERGSFLQQMTPWKGVCCSMRDNMIMVRDIGGSWLKGEGIKRNNELKTSETFDNWVI